MDKYTSTIKSMSFLYNELKIACKLVLQGVQEKELKQKSIEENIFMVNSESRKKEIASTAAKRIKALDEFSIEKIANGNLQTSKQLALYSILKTDRLFFEFMNDVYKDKYILRYFIIEDKDLDIFFQKKAQQNDKIASWKEYTFYKLKQVYKRILIEAGFAKKNNKNIEIIPPIMEIEVIEHLKEKGDTAFLNAMLGEI
ncbi:DUF1819 family protein [Tepidibacter mesophilus]|uniref:DUF1819 family protein n=1 Tax=Tepidibacter mesophilus TaxID=655607 RepID=UPI000C06F544|nr:DUF1819 family protein [Tepidibacter mesophilus]